MRYGIAILLLVVIWGKLCAQKNGTDQNRQSLFTMLSASETGIDFRNEVTETREANIFIYKNFYQGGGVAIGDINNDGLLDLYFTGNQVGDKLYLNKGNLQFVDITSKAGIINDGSWSFGVTIVDINNDGLKDIYVCKSLYNNQPEKRRNKLYINNGNSTFTESAAKYGLDDPWRSVQASFLDYDKDGDLDMFLINQPPNPSRLAPAEGADGRALEFMFRFFENKGGKFEDVTAEAGLLNPGYGLNAIAADFNNDGWQDIYVSNDYDGPDFLYINNKNKTFTNTINESMKHISNFSMGSDVGDINRDGWIDLAVVDMVAEDNYRLKANMSGMEPARFWKTVSNGGHYQYMFNTLQLNNGANDKGILSFSDIGQMAGVSNTDWSWSPLLADFDNDGLLDLFVSNGIKREIRNSDAIRKMDEYLEDVVKKMQLQNQNITGTNLIEKVDLDTMLSFFPIQKLKNYVFRNKGNLIFEKAMQNWGLEQETFSTGAAYGDLDNDGDIDLVVNNVDDVSAIYRNNQEKRNKNHYLRIKLKANKKELSFYGSRATIYYGSKKQMAELSSSKGINSSSEEVFHFGLGQYSGKIDSIEVVWNDGKVSLSKNVSIDQTWVIDHTGSTNTLLTAGIQKNNRIFEDVTEAWRVNFSHVENTFDDFETEVLLPHKMSTLGPGLAVGDMNGDALEDFFIGGASGQSGKLFIQNKAGQFTENTPAGFSTDAVYEDMGAVWFDADSDGDLDLYVVSGGNEYGSANNPYQDRLYINDGKGQLTNLPSALPVLTSSGSRVKVADYDSDGDLDLFVGGRQVPGRYPEPTDSYILKNQWKETGTLHFIKLEDTALKNMGMVTDAVWSDYDKDGDLDLIVVGEWMPITILENEKGHFVNKVHALSLTNTTGWWSSITAEDLDGDGDDDYVLGNLGLNYKYKASPTEPFTVYYKDFDNNGHNDIVLGYYNYGELFPLRGRSCSSQQIPDIKKKFVDYNAFASSNLKEVYGEQNLNQSLHYEVQMFQSVCMRNMGGGNFDIKQLPSEAQISSINSTVVADVDGDGIKDLIVAGNMYGSEIETPRNDASVGLFLKGLGGCNYKPVPPHQSGLYLPYDVKDMKLIKLGKENALIVAVNNAPARLIKIRNK
ncbi:MAG: VCBS repeat-containing protein [Cyclobacteriaceae bacterium]